MDLIWVAVVGAFVLAGSLLVQIVVGVLTIRKLLLRPERIPPVPEEMYREFVRKEDLQGLERRLDLKIDNLGGRYEKTIGEVFGTMRALQTSLDSTLRDLTRDLGRVDGRLSAHMENHP